MRIQTIPTLASATFDAVVGRKQPVLTSSEHIAAAIDWLCRAQDTWNDGGVASWYSLMNGWYTSYIETTGYIITTFLDCAEQFNHPNISSDELISRAVRMGDFLLSMQHESGGFRTHVPAQKFVSEPTVFDTGQDLLGLSDIYELSGNESYRTAAVKAANFLCDIQEPDGSWFKYTYGSRPHTYHTRVAWGLLKVFAITGTERYKQAAIRNLRWCAAQQQPNGWFRQNELPPPNHSVPFTHTISYAIEGFLFSGLMLNDNELIYIAQRAAVPLLNHLLITGFMPASFDGSWNTKDRYSCLTGNAQLCIIWLHLFELTHDKRYWTGAQQLLQFLKSTQYVVAGPKDIRGAIAGSYPIFGEIIRLQGYCRMAYLNWSTKFFIDALLYSERLQSLAQSLP